MSMKMRLLFMSVLRSWCCPPAVRFAAPERATLWQAPGVPVPVAGLEAQEGMAALPDAVPGSRLPDTSIQRRSAGDKRDPRIIGSATIPAGGRENLDQHSAEA